MLIDAPKYRARIRRYWPQRNHPEVGRRRYARSTIRIAIRRLRDAGEGRPAKRPDPAPDAHNTQPSRPADQAPARQLSIFAI